MKENKSMKNHQQYFVYAFVVMFVAVIVVLSFLSFMLSLSFQKYIIIL